MKTSSLCTTAALANRPVAFAQNPLFKGAATVVNGASTYTTKNQSSITIGGIPALIISELLHSAPTNIANQHNTLF